MRLETVVDDEFGAAVKRAAADQGVSVMELSRRALARVVSEPCPYPFQGFDGPSLVRDMATIEGWATDQSSAYVDEARERIRRFERWSQDVAAKFQQSTSTAGEIVPTGYLAAVTIELTADRPLASACLQAPIRNAAPFTVPTAVGDGTVDASRVEGSNPAGTDPSFGSVQVSPKGLAGTIEMSRELVDSASPGGDLIALAIMREDWQRQAEIRIYEALNAAQSGTITNGRVPSGAQARTVASPDTELAVELRKALVGYANVRRRRPRSFIAGAAAADALAGQLDESANGVGEAMWRIWSASGNVAVNDFGTSSGDARLLILGTDDVVNFESPLASFRFDEAAGPGTVRCAVWGYHAVAVARPVGVASIRFS